MIFDDSIVSVSDMQLEQMGFGKLHVLEKRTEKIKFIDIYECCLKVYSLQDIRKNCPSVILHEDERGRLFFNYGLSTLFVESSTFDEPLDNTKYIYSIYIDTATFSLMLNSFKEGYATILWELGLAKEKIELTSRGLYWLEIEDKDRLLDDDFEKNYNFTTKIPSVEDVLSEEDLIQSMKDHDEYDDEKSDKTIIERYENFQKQRRSEGK